MSLRSQRSRTFATSTVVALGVGLCVGSVAVGGAGRAAVQDQFDQRRAREVVLQDTGKDLRSSRDFSPSLNTELINLGGVVSAGPLLELQGVDAYPNRNQRLEPYLLSVYGIDPSTLDALGADTDIAVWWRPGVCDVREGLIGKKAAESMQVRVDSANPTTVDVNGVPIAIIGTVETAQTRAGLLNGLVVPECTARAIGLPVVSREVIIRVEPGAADLVAERAPLVVRPGTPTSLEASYVPNAVGLRRAIEQTTQRLILIFGVAASVMSVLVMGISTASSVALRRAELGLRRVFGARKLDLYLQVLLETSLLGFVSGAIGGTLGMAAVLAASSTLGWVFIVPNYLFLVGAMAGGLIGVLAGILPAFLATRVEPRAALQAPL